MLLGATMHTSFRSSCSWFSKGRRSIDPSYLFCKCLGNISLSKGQRHPYWQNATEIQISWPRKSYQAYQHKGFTTQTPKKDKLLLVEPMLHSSTCVGKLCFFLFDVFCLPQQPVFYIASQPCHVHILLCIHEAHPRDGWRSYPTYSACEVACIPLFGVENSSRLLRLNWQKNVFQKNQSHTCCMCLVVP